MWIAALVLAACVSAPPCEEIRAILDAHDSSQPAASRLQGTADALAALDARDPEVAAKLSQLSATLSASAGIERELEEIAATMEEMRAQLAASRAGDVPTQLTEVTTLLQEVDRLQARLDVLGKQSAARHVERAGQEAWLKRRCEVSTARQ